MRISNAVRHIGHIATLPLAPHIVIPEMLRALDGVVPGAQPGFFWVDGDGAILDAYMPSPPPEGTLSTVVQVASACRRDRRTAAGTLFHYQDDGGFQMTLRGGGGAQAVLSMRRPARAGSFTERDRRILAELAPCFARALDASEVTRQSYDDLPDRVGVIVADGEGLMLSADPDALRMLLEMTDQPLGRDGRWPGVEDRLPHFLVDLVRRGGGAQLQKAARWGVYRARGFAQTGLAGGTGSHAIMLSRHLPRIVRLMRTIETCDLSPRERQATFQLGIGADSAAAAAALGVSIATWRSYVKRVYQRLDVRDRIELMSFLSGGALA